MGWWWSSSTPRDGQSKQPPPSSDVSIPPTSPSNPPSKPSADADFHAAYPYLAPATPSAPPPSQESTALSPEYPTTMSCRAAFDSAFYCTSFGGHFNDIYRYGELRSCSEHWADWRFCMGLKTLPRAEKERAIQGRYREKEERVRQKPNSEDIWSRRAEGKRDFGAFTPVHEEIPNR